LPYPGIWSLAEGGLVGKEGNKIFFFLKFVRNQNITDYDKIIFKIRSLPPRMEQHGILSSSGNRTQDSRPSDNEKTTTLIFTERSMQSLVNDELFVLCSITSTEKLKSLNALNLNNYRHKNSISIKPEWLNTITKYKIFGKI
jgi:hypothetical protein